MFGLCDLGLLDVLFLGGHLSKVQLIENVVKKIGFSWIGKVDYPLTVLLLCEFVKSTVSLVLIRTMALDAIGLNEPTYSIVENLFLSLKVSRKNDRKGKAQRWQKSGHGPVSSVSRTLRAFLTKC